MKKSKPTRAPKPRKSVVTKSEVVAILEDMGAMLEIVGANPFKVRLPEREKIPPAYRTPLRTASANTDALSGSPMECQS